MMKIINNVIKSQYGIYIISILLGLGLASLFRKACKNKNCMEFKGPKMSDLKDQIYSYNENCYQFNEESIKCGIRKRSVDFAENVKI